MASGDFRWNDWNLDHATKHGCRIAEMESVVRHPGRGFPRDRGNDKWFVQGRGQGDRMIEVVYVLDEDDTFYVIRNAADHTAEAGKTIATSTSR